MVAEDGDFSILGRQKAGNVCYRSGKPEKEKWLKLQTWRR